MTQITIEQTRDPKPYLTGQWLVKIDGEIVGLLEKYQDTMAQTHPWTAYRKTGRAVYYLGDFYEKESVPIDCTALLGGQRAAVAAILLA